jgi:[acyl-carrier-protein] S-malonyltransferase
MKIAYIFPGQGSQALDMGMEFINNFELGKELIQQANDRLDFNIENVLQSKELLSQTEFAQPAILFVSSLINQVFTSRIDTKAEFALGHSLGEFSALVSAGALDVIDAMDLVHNRGIFMKECCDGLDAGMMVILGLSDEVVEDFTSKCQDQDLEIYPANYNMDGQIVLAGKKKDLLDSQNELRELGAKKTIILDMSVASHCPLLKKAGNNLEPLLEKYIKDNFNMPIISNVSKEAYSTKKEAVRLLKKQLTKPVKYKQSISKFDDVDLFVEFGNSEVLAKLNKKITKVKTITIKSVESLENTISLINAS